eukprot:CAMPEP_0180218312 /NCGR_PEP_ID=MMETSP0987-20121128/17593_1 /TAXON_ID=697907 /ORGANISM="non described non described, Strain CCMP2293" /LENGTH=99 /DNA_ID=CAMNT_0022178291 /DNA_START=572 /DNA_END=872 /DNA_ORIENTATION=+
MHPFVLPTGPRDAAQFMLGAAEDAPYTWKGGRAIDPTDSYNGESPLTLLRCACTPRLTPPLPHTMFEDLDTSSQPYFYSTPVDPTEYQNEYIGQVIGIY